MIGEDDKTNASQTRVCTFFLAYQGKKRSGRRKSGRRMEETPLFSGGRPFAPRNILQVRSARDGKQNKQTIRYILVSC